MVKFLFWWAALAFVMAGLWPHLLGDGPFGVVGYVLVMGFFTGMMGGLVEVLADLLLPWLVKHNFMSDYRSDRVRRYIGHPDPRL